MKVVIFNPVVIVYYGLKYWLEYTNINGDTYTLNIFEGSFSGSATEIRGSVTHDYSDRKDLIQPIVSSSLRIDLEANTDLTLQDLYSENERNFKVELLRNSVLIFQGYLKPDGIWEDYVSERWVLSLDAMDGLSMLKELAFVKEDGTFFDATLSHFDIISNCLKRIGYTLPINVSEDLPIYDGFTGTNGILKAVFSSTERYYQDVNKSVPMDCESVLKSILDIYGATIIQMNGEWWIFRAIDVKASMDFLRYTESNPGVSHTWNAGITIGSHIDNFDLFHVNSNQKKSIDPSIQAFRVSYKYGFAKSLLSNTSLKSDALGNVDGWTIDSLATIVPNSEGVSVEAQSPSFSGTVIATNQSSTFQQGDSIKAMITAFTQGTIQPLQIQIKNENYYFNNGEWSLSSGFIYVPIGGSTQNNIEIELPPLEVSGSVDIAIEFPTYYGTGQGFEEVTFTMIDLVPLSSDNKKGEFHTVQRMTRISSVTDDDIEVHNGDSISEIYYGTILKENGDTTTAWNRHRVEDGDNAYLLRLMAEDRLRISPKPMTIFEGDVYGYFPYLSLAVINNIVGNFQFVKYSLNTNDNINRLVSREFANAYLTLDTDFIYEFDYDYGNEERVVIKS